MLTHTGWVAEVALTHNATQVATQFYQALVYSSSERMETRSQVMALVLAVSRVVSATERLPLKGCSNALRVSVLPRARDGTAMSYQARHAVLRWKHTSGALERA